VSTGRTSASSNTGTTVIGRAPVTDTGAAAIVILEPRHSAPLPEPATTPYMDQLARNFIPSVLFVRTGHRAQFLNSDEELHNVNVKNGKTLEQAFNVALPPGISYVHTFEQSGVYDVSCDAHSGMSAQIIAASSPYVALADSNGHFEIPHVVPGMYAVTVYAGAEPIEKTVEVTGLRTEVDVTRQ
jgi:plastocyanin